MFERIENGKLTVSKVTFGAEPKDYEVYDFILHHYYELKLSPLVSTDVKQVADNPKRKQRSKEQYIHNLDHVSPGGRNTSSAAGICETSCCANSTSDNCEISLMGILHFQKEKDV